jgi:hypothetical protein
MQLKFLCDLTIEQCDKIQNIEDCAIKFNTNLKQNIEKFIFVNK